MIVQCAERCDAQVKALVFKTGIKAEIDFWHAAAQYHLIFGVYFTVIVYVFIEAVTNLGAFLCGVVVKIFLRAGDAFINPTVELTDFLAYFSDVRT